jgi:MFS family permease
VRPATRDAGRLAYAAFVGFGALDAAGYGVIGPVTPAISEATGAGPTATGALVATFGVAMAIGFWPAGVAIQRYGATMVLAVSVALLALGTAGFVAFESLPAYFASRALQGLGSGGLWLGIALGVIERWPGSEFRRLSGVMAAYAVGGIAGPALGSIGGIRGPFLAYLGFVALGALALTVIGAPHQHAPAFGSDRAVLRAPGFAVSTAGVTLIAVMIGMFDGVLPLHFEDRLSQAEIGALYVGTSLLIALFAVVGGRLPMRSTLAVATVIIVAGLALAGAGDAVWVWIVACAMAGVGFGLGETATLGFLLDAVGAERMMLAMVVWSQIFALGYLVGPVAGGAVADSLGYGAIGIVPLAFGAAVILTMLRLPKQGRPAADA